MAMRQASDKQGRHARAPAFSPKLGPIIGKTEINDVVGNVMLAPQVPGHRGQRA